jgi:hypothetical protein
MCIWTFSNITDYINTTFRKQTAFLFWCIWRRQQSALETSCFCSQWRWQKPKHTTAISRKFVILCQWSYIDWVKKCFWFHNRKHNGMPHTKVVSVSTPRHHKWSDPFRFSNQNIILHLPGAFLSSLFNNSDNTRWRAQISSLVQQIRFIAEQAAPKLCFLVWSLVWSPTGGYHGDGRLLAATDNGRHFIKPSWFPPAAGQRGFWRCKFTAQFGANQTDTMKTLLVLEAVMHFMGVHRSYDVIQGAEHYCVVRQFIFNPLQQCFPAFFYRETHKIICNIPRNPYQQKQTQ